MEQPQTWHHGLVARWWAEFNVADAAITCGAILLGIDMIFFAEAEPGKGTGWRQFKAWLGRGNGGANGPGS